MPGGPLQWQFEIFDKLSAPARQMEKATSGVEKAMKGATAATDKAEAAAGHAGLKWTEFASKMHVITSVARGAGDVLGWVAGKTVGLVDKLGGLQSESLSFELLLGKRGGADLLAYIDRVAQHTQFTGGALKKMVHPLAMQGFGVKDISRMLPAAADIGALTGGGEKGAAATAQALQLFASIKATGRLSRGAYESLGLTKMDVMGRLSAATGIKGDKLEAAMESGKIPAARLLETLFAGISDKVNGPLGTGAIRASKTVDALMEKIRSAPGDVVERMLGKPAVYDAIQRVLARIMEIFDQLVARFATDEGAKELEDGINKVVDAFLRMTKIVPTVINLIGAAGGVIIKMAEGSERLLNAILKIGELTDVFGLGGKGSVLSGPASSVGDAGKDLSKAYVDNGKELYGAIFAGMSQVSQWAELGSKHAQEYVAGFRGSNGIDARSPSRLFERIAGYIEAGLDRGADFTAAGAGHAADYANAFAPALAFPDAFAPPVRGRGGAPAGGVSGGTQFGDVNVYVGAAPAGASPREFADMIGDAIESRLEEYASAIGVPS